MELKQTIFTLAAADTPHAYYKENVENAKLYKAITSGRGLDDYMQQFKPREEAELFEQRKRITCHIVPSVCKNVRDVEYKVPRSNSISKVYIAEDEKKLKELKKILDKFWGRYSFDNYMALRWIELNDTDPNAFIVVEWKPFEKSQRAQPYPFEVLSHMAWDYKFENNILQWLLVKEGEKLIKWTLYGKDATIQLVEVPTDKGDQYEALPGFVKEDGTEYEVYEAKFVKFGKRYYMILEPKPHNLGEVPAVQVGYMRDPSNNGATYLPPWWAALPTLRNLITAKSELDLTEALHVFPQKIQYAPRCDAEDCNNGRTPEGGRCKVCKGTGYQIHTSAQDAITLALPKTSEELFDLVKLIHYVYPPTELIRYMDEYVDKLSQRCMQFVYNSEIYSRKEVAETATGKNIDLQAVYDTLYPMVEEMAIDWEFLIGLIQKITDLDKGISAQFIYSKDFKLKSLDNYYTDLATVNQSGGSSFIKSAIEDDIARMLYADDNYQLLRYQVKRRFDPFSGDSEQIIMTKLQNPNVSLESKILYLNFELIFDTIEQTVDGFYEMAFEKQQKIINEQVEAIKQQNKSTAAEARAQTFGVV